MKLTFIVVTYQRDELLAQCLASIYAQDHLPPYEIILIDNSGSAQIPTPPHGQKLHIERSTKNMGATGGRNRGMQLAQGQYLIFIDDDAAWHDERDVARLMAILDEHPQCAAVATRSLHPQTKASILQDMPHPNKHYIQAVNQPTEVPYFYGMAHALRASAIQEVGDYPPRYFYVMEEVDLSLRLIEAGYQILYHPDVAVFHSKSDLGRSRSVAELWWRSTLNKSRLGWRLLPYPYPWTILFFWSLRTLINTRNPLVMTRVWRDLWRERTLLHRERHPISPETVRYLKRIGARLLY